MATQCPIPQPPTIPFLGNSMLVDLEVPLRSFMRFAKDYGEIYQLTFSSGTPMVNITTAAMLRQVSDDSNFKKCVSRSLREVRNLTGDGLFTADIDEPNWGLAHRILMPAFRSSNIRNMFPLMQDICSQLLLKWARFQPSHAFDPYDDYTRLTFDTIALCSMSHRFNSFYESEMPAFPRETTEFLGRSSRRAFRPPFMKILPYYYKKEDEKYFADARHMTDIAREIVRQRREQPLEKADLLTLMLEGKDPKTGEQLPEENIIYNILTLLIAGHETTTGLLAFATYHLLKNPSCLEKLRQELDDVLGSEEPTVEDLGKMPYLTAILRETLRLHPPGPARSTSAKHDIELIGGDGDASNPSNKRYLVKKDQLIVVHLVNTHRDPLVWGEDAEVFLPERMLDGKFERLLEQTWQPFGYGMRACIGRAFAWQEAMLVLASVFSQFNVSFDDPSYELEIKQELTIKPKNMLVRVSQRERRRTSVAVPKPISVNENAEEQHIQADPALIDLYILHDGNGGAGQSLAQRIASNAQIHGFKAHLSNLDDKISHLPNDGPAVIMTATSEDGYVEGAAQFFVRMSEPANETEESSLCGVSFLVYRPGNCESARKGHQFPSLIEKKSTSSGSEQLLEFEVCDVGPLDIDEFERRMWGALANVKYWGPGQISEATDVLTSCSNLVEVEKETKRNGCPFHELV